MTSTLNRTNTPILHLNLKLKWFHLIFNGIKCEEYREIKPFWNRVFVDGKIKIKGKYYHPSDVVICFSNGYSKDRKQFYIECNGLRVGLGVSALGAKPDRQYYILDLGNKITL